MKSVVNREAKKLKLEGLTDSDFLAILRQILTLPRLEVKKIADGHHKEASTFEVILANALIYDEKNFDALEKILDRLLGRPTQQIVQEIKQELNFDLSEYEKIRDELKIK